MDTSGFLEQALVYLAAGVIAVPIFQRLGLGSVLGDLVAGMAFAMSSTAIGLQTLTEKNLLPTPGGQASFAVLLFQDLSVVPLLLVLAFLGGDAEPFHWTDAAKAAGFIVALIATGRVLVRPALRYIAETRLREVFVGFSLF